MQLLFIILRLCSSALWTSSATRCPRAWTTTRACSTRTRAPASATAHNPPRWTATADEVDCLTRIPGGNQVQVANFPLNRPTYHHLLMLEKLEFCSLGSYRFFRYFFFDIIQQHFLSLGVTSLFNSNLSYCRCFPLVSLLGEWRVEWGAKIQLKLWAENQTSCCKLPCGIKLKSDY